MTCEDFIRNNRGINGGENLPQEFLAQLYESIKRNEIRISSEAPFAPDPAMWTQVAQASISPRGAVLNLTDLGTLLVFPDLTSVHHVCTLRGKRKRR